MLKLIIATLITLVSCADPPFGPQTGRFFYAGLAEETTTYRLAYYTNMNIGTRTLSGIQYHY